MKSIRISGSIRVINDNKVTDIDLSNGGQGIFLHGHQVRKYVRQLARQLKRAAA